MTQETNMTTTSFPLMMIVNTNMASRASVSAPCPTSMLALHSQAIRGLWQEEDHQEDHQPQQGIWARKQMGDEQYQLVLDYDRGDTRDAAKNARTRYAKLKRQYNPNMQGSSQQQGEYQWQDYLHTELQGSSQQQGESSPQPNKRYTHITDSGQMIDFDKKDPRFAHIPDRWLK